MKKLLIPITLALLLLPFVFIQTIYPFFRFGMFAEVESKSVEEEFLIQYKFQNQNTKSWKLLNASDLGFDDSVFELMKRNYYYRGEGELLLEKSDRAFLKIEHPKRKLTNDISEWRLIRESAESDTIFLAVDK